MYVMVDATEPLEETDYLPVIQIIREGLGDHQSLGLQKVSTAVIDVTTFLGKDQSEYIPFVIELWDSKEPNCPTFKKEEQESEDKEV